MKHLSIFLSLTTLLAAAPAIGQTPPDIAPVLQNTPDGEGQSDAVVCRKPQQLPGSRMLGPRVCKTNAVWAQYRRDGMDVAADGIHDVQNEKYRSTHPMVCRPATPGGSGTSNMNQANLGVICE